MDSYRKYGIRASGGIYKYLTIDKIYTHILVILSIWVPDIMFVYLSHNKKIKVMLKKLLVLSLLVSSFTNAQTIIGSSYKPTVSDAIRSIEVGQKSVSSAVNWYVSERNSPYLYVTSDNTINGVKFKNREHLYKFLKNPRKVYVKGIKVERYAFGTVKMTIRGRVFFVTPYLRRQLLKSL